MENHEEVRIKLANIQLKNHESAAENKTGATLKITKKSF